MKDQKEGQKDSVKNCSKEYNLPYYMMILAEIIFRQKEENKELNNEQVVYIFKDIFSAEEIQAAIAELEKIELIYTNEDGHLTPKQGVDIGQNRRRTTYERWEEVRKKLRVN